MVDSWAVDGEAVDTGGTRYWTLLRAARESGMSQTTLRKYLRNYLSNDRPQLTPVHEDVVSKLFGGSSSALGGRPVSTVLLAHEVRALVSAADQADSGSAQVVRDLDSDTVPAGSKAEPAELRAALVKAGAEVRRWENLFRTEQAMRVFIDERARDQLAQFTGPPDPEDLVRDEEASPDADSCPQVDGGRR